MNAVGYKQGGELRKLSPEFLNSKFNEAPKISK
jgi:hypothetical protein